MSDTMPGRRVYLADGRSLPGWSIESHLADGSLSSVYRVRYTGLRHNELPAQAALKITPLLPVDRERLVEEYETARRFSDHPQVVQVYDVFEVDTPEYGPCIALVHELGEESLKDRLEHRGPLDPPELWRLTADLAGGIAALHDARIIHSDVKPGNILRFAEGWKLADLGAASKLSGTSTTTHTGSADYYAGTLAYSTPETAEALHQNREPPPVHRDIDTWAFGIVVHEAATGHRPFASTAALIQGVARLDPSLDPRVAAVVEACLKPAGTRPRDGRALVALVDDPPVVRPPRPADNDNDGAVGAGAGSPPPRSAEANRLRRYLLIPAVAAALVASGAGVTALALADRRQPPSEGATASTPTGGTQPVDTTASPSALSVPGAPAVVRSTLLDGRMAVEGTVRRPEEAEALVSLLETVVGPGQVDNRLVVDQRASTPSALSLAVVDEIVFAPGSSSIEAAFLPTLDQLVALMAIDPGMTVIVRGHTDSTGDPVANLALSQRRAESVVTYFASQGINGFRLEPQGRGSTEPVGDNATFEGRRHNRRIELAIQGLALDRLLQSD